MANWNLYVTFFQLNSLSKFSLLGIGDALLNSSRGSDLGKQS